MSSEAQTFIKDYKEHIEKQAEFIEDSGWITNTSRDYRRSRHDTIYKLVKSSLERLKFYINIADEGDRKLKTSKYFIEIIVKLLNEYSKQCKEYLNTEDWTIYGSLLEDKVDKHQNDEIDFQNSILENINKINVDLTKLNLEDLINEVVIPIYADKRAPLLMRNTFRNKFPIINKFIEQNELKDVFSN